MNDKPILTCLNCGKKQRHKKIGKSWKKEGKCYECATFDSIVKVNMVDSNVEYNIHKFNPVDMYFHPLAVRMVAMGEMD